MAIAKGTRSRLSYAQETAYATTLANTPPYTGVTFRSETMDETINTIRSQEIRPDRATPSIRGSNVATGGNMVTDFAVRRHLMFMQHLFGAPDTALTPIAVTIDATANTVTETGHNRLDGNEVFFTGGPIPPPLVAGVLYYVRDASAGTTYKLALYPGGAAIDLTGTGTAVHVIPPFKRNYWTSGAGGGVVVALTNGLDVTRGTYYTLGGNLFLCRKGGTVSGDVAGDLTITDNGESQTLPGGTIFFALGIESDYAIEEYVVVGGKAMPVPGLAIEKQILGGNEDLFVLFRGCRIDSLALDIPQEGIVGATWAILGKDVDPAKSVAFSAATTVTPGEDPVSGFEAFIGIGINPDPVSQSTRPVSQGSLTISNQFDPKTFVLGERYRRDLPEGTRSISGKFTLYFEDTTEYGIFDNEQQINVEMSFDHNGYYGAFLMPEAKLTGSGTPKVSGMGPVTADYELTAYKQTSTNELTYIARIPMLLA